MSNIGRDYIQKGYTLKIDDFTPENLVAYKTVHGTIIAFIITCPKIVGKGKTAEEALDNLLDTYKAILKTVHELKRACD